MPIQKKINTWAITHEWVPFLNLRKEHLENSMEVWILRGRREIVEPCGITSHYMVYVLAAGSKSDAMSYAMYNTPAKRYKDMTWEAIPPHRLPDEEAVLEYY